MSAPQTDSPESYRDHLSTVDEAGRRVILYPTRPKGKFHRARVIVAWFLLAFMFGAPFIRVNDHPLMLLNIFERKFVIFGIAFWPQDFYLFVFAVLAFVVFIVLFTVIFGRLWCGWACPQTIFMEMVFRKIEYWIEGNAGRQRKLDRSPWTAEKTVKKTSKHVIYLAISFMVGNIVVAWMVGTEKLQQLVVDGPGSHIAEFLGVVAFSLLTYGVFARFREQVCLIVCPYGRLQSVLLDDKSIVVSYDFKRGEPRKPMSLKKSDLREAGDCIICNSCVDVCPTGIDIRNGTQLECINCTACMDACDAVMDKVGFERGLVRYASHKHLEEGVRLKVTPRIIGYSAVLVALLGLLMFLLLGRSDFETTIFRTPGVMYEEIDNHWVRNLYSIKVINKTINPHEVELRLKGTEGSITMIGGDISLPKEGLAETAFFVDIPMSMLSSSRQDIEIEVFAGGELVETIGSTFLGPRQAARSKTSAIDSGAGI